MTYKALAFLMTLHMITTQAFSSANDLFERYSSNAPAGFVLTQTHLDALNTLLENEHLSFETTRSGLGVEGANALQLTFKLALTPEEITRVASFKPPAWASYLLLPFAKEKSDAFMASCASLLRDIRFAPPLAHHGHAREVMKHAEELSPNRLDAIATCHLPYTFLRVILEDGEDVPDERLSSLAQLYKSIYIPREGNIDNNELLEIKGLFLHLSPDHVQGVIEAPFEPDDADKRLLLLRNAHAFSADLLGPIGRLFVNHPQKSDFFANIKAHHASRESLEHIIQLPRHLQARYVVSGVAPPSLEEEALLLTLFKDTDEAKVASTLARTKPSLLELSQLASLDIPPSRRIAALYAKDFIPLIQPDPVRLGLFLSLLEGRACGCSIAKICNKNQHLEKLFLFNKQGVPPHVREALLEAFLADTLPLNRLQAVLPFLPHYTLKEQRKICSKFDDRTLCLPEDAFTWLTKSQLPADTVLSFLCYASRLSPEVLGALMRMIDRLDEGDYPYEIYYILHYAEKSEYAGIIKTIDSDIEKVQNARASTS